MKLFATAIGNSQNPPLIFIHDFMQTSMVWSPIINELQNNFYCITIDLPGHGKSTNTSFDTWDDVITECGKVLTLIKRPTIIIGQGLGGRIALGLCNTFQDQIKKLILIETIPGISDALSKQKQYIEDLRLFNDLGSKLTSEQSGWKNAIKFLSIGRMPDYNKTIKTNGSKIYYLLNKTDQAQMKLGIEYKEICEMTSYSGEPSELFPTLMEIISNL